MIKRMAKEEAKRKQKMPHSLIIGDIIYLNFSHDIKRAGEEDK